MSFPSWAPKALVEEFNKLREEAVKYRRMDAIEKNINDEPSVGEPHLFHTTDWQEEAVKIDELADTLSRLLNNYDMKAAWVELTRPAADPKPWKRDPEFLVWNCVTRALGEFQMLIAIAQTPSEKKKNLLSVVSMAKELLAAITADPTADYISKVLMERYLTIKNFKHREDMGDTPTPAEYQTPLRFSSDCGELQFIRAKGSGKGESPGELTDLEDYEANCYWDKMPLAMRLTYWTKEAKNTNLTDLLRLYVDILRFEAEQPPEIKQPGRKDAAIKPFLIRRLNEHMVWYYGQPLDEVVAQIVSTVLNLPTPLTRDDVRPYIAGPGKKST